MGGGVVGMDAGGGALRCGWGGAGAPEVEGPHAAGRRGPPAAKAGALPPARLLLDEVAAAAARDPAGLALLRPADRGQVVDWPLEHALWARALGPAGLGAPPGAQTAGLAAVVPPFMLPSLGEALLETCFEEFRFPRFLPGQAGPLALAQHAPGPEWVAAGGASGCGVVLDCGFSSTHAVPVLGGAVVQGAVRRLDLGGAGLTRLLQDEISLRSVNIAGEELVAEQCKHDACFVSADPLGDLRAAGGRARPHRAEYLLPDGASLTRGRLRTHEEMLEAASQARAAAGGGGAARGAKGRGPQVAVLNQERFMVPEALFRPANVGLNQGGVAELVAEAVNACPAAVRPAMWGRVLVTGGGARLGGFEARLRSELRSLAPDTVELGLESAADPERAAWRGLSQVAASPAFEQLAVTREEYEERGAAYFADLYL